MKTNFLTKLLGLPNWEIFFFSIFFFPKKYACEIIFALKSRSSYNIHPFFHTLLAHFTLYIYLKEYYIFCETNKSYLFTQSIINFNYTILFKNSFFIFLSFFYLLSLSKVFIFFYLLFPRLTIHLEYHISSIH